MKKIIILFVFLMSSNLIAQNLNSYKYIIIPTKYKILNTEDQYKLNSLTKFLFEKENFITLFSNEKLPNNLLENSCLALQMNLIKNTAFLSTVVSIELKDCNNKIIFTSKKGKSKIKDYKRSYHEALRDAFTSIISLNYKYNETKSTQKQDSEKQLVVTTTTSIASTVLNAVKTKLGFKILDKDSKIKYELIESSVKNVYHLKNKTGIIYKENNEWFFEINVNNTINTKKLNLKF